LVPSLLPKPDTHHLAARELARRHAPNTSVDDGGAEFREAWKRFADFGLYSLTIPDAGLDVEAVLGTLEGLGEGTRNAGFLLAVGPTASRWAPPSRGSAARANAGGCTPCGMGA
jgi:hypothetical protein